MLIMHAHVFATPVFLDDLDISPRTFLTTIQRNTDFLREQNASDTMQTLLDYYIENDSNSFIVFSQLSIYKKNIAYRLLSHGFSPESTASTPVNEPATMLLLGSGIASLAALRRRRNKSK